VLTIKRADGKKQEVTVVSRLNTDNEIEYFKSGGILQYVLNNLARSAA
jgi:aconitate hydratase